MRLALICLLAAANSAVAQVPVRIQVVSAADSTPIADALVKAGAVQARSGAIGLAALIVPAGVTSVTVSRIGYASVSVAVGTEVRTDSIVVALTPVSEIEGMVIAATRSERRIEDDPLRVEFINREEVEEKIRMTPGDITMMLNETPGLRVVTTSPSLGGANVRVQGMRGRYTQILSDGLPLFGGQTGGLGLLQIPPMDLGGVEVIKGVASALYGGNALGGVINLRSRPPTEDPVYELLVNQTMLSGSDLIGFASRMFGESVGGSLLLGGHRQAARDVDDDLLVDVPQYDRLVVRPRLYLNDVIGGAVMFTGGMTRESRSGGRVYTLPMGPPAHPESLTTRRYDFGGTARWELPAQTSLMVRGSVARQAHHHRFGPDVEDDRHLSTFTEASLTLPVEKATFVIGGALQREVYRNDHVPEYDFRFTTPGAFGQVTVDATEQIALTASIRADHHSEYKEQTSGRVSALFKGPAETTLRISFGNGFFAPTPLTEETEVTGLRVLIEPRPLSAERATTFSADLGKQLGPLELNATFFRSTIDNPITVAPSKNAFLLPSDYYLTLRNAIQPTKTSGLDLTGRWELEPLHVTASYTFIDASEYDIDLPGRRLVPLTPRHQGGLVAAWEAESFRVGAEAYYTGRQPLKDNPYRTESKPYTHLGVLVEQRFGSARVFVNAENLLNFKQSDVHPLSRPTRGPGGRWTVDAWGPLEGRTANVGVRFGIGE